MRVVKEISYPEYRLTLLNWNNRYLIKLESGGLEQTYKIEQYDFVSDDEVIKILDEQFLQKALQRFKDMSRDLAEARNRLESE